MQNLMIGASGSGKGYEGCVYQILPALQKGRKVITNMPLDLDKWRSLDPSFPDLIELRKIAQPIRGTWEPTREEGAFNIWPDGRVVIPPPTARPFAAVWDYFSDWRHPDTGQGPLFVVDEAQYVIPVGKTDIQLEEWSALHRHFNCDILWMTQSYGKLSKTVRDNVQMVYRLRKKTAWGQPNRYIRKVQDGVRGEVMNTMERQYEKRYFGLWKSHTQGVAAEEFAGEDIKSFYHHWTFRGAAICGVLAICLAMYALSDPSAEPAKPYQPVQVKQDPLPDHSGAHQPPPEQVASEPPPPPAVVHPYATHTLHLLAMIRTDDRFIGYIGVAQNGQVVNTVKFDDLRQAGYTITYHSDSIVSLSYGGRDIGFVIMDIPRQSLTPATAKS